MARSPTILAHRTLTAGVETRAISGEFTPLRATVFDARIACTVGSCHRKRSAANKGSPPKEGSHYDLPIALGLMVALGAIPADALAGYVVIGELSLDGTISAVAGALPAAVGANAMGLGLLCPAACGAEAAWASADMPILAPRSLIQIANHFRGTQVLSRPEPAICQDAEGLADLSDIRGQPLAKRALEVAAAGGHNLLMFGYINMARGAAYGLAD